MMSLALEDDHGTPNSSGAPGLTTSTEAERLRDARESLQMTFEVWKKAIEVQQHFINIRIQIRSIAISVVTATLGASGLALKDNTRISFMGSTTSLAAWVLMAGLFAWGAFYALDILWYHRLLIGSVRHAELIERNLEGRVPNIGLTMSITNESRIPRLGRNREQSHFRFKLFYGGIGALLLVFVVLLARA